MVGLRFRASIAVFGDWVKYAFKSFNYITEKSWSEYIE